jgi:hypothetical protein
MLRAYAELSPVTSAAPEPQRVPTLTEVLQAQPDRLELAEDLAQAQQPDDPLPTVTFDEPPATSDAEVLDQLYLDVQAEVMAALAPRLQELIQPLVAEVVKKAIHSALGGPR